MAKMPGAYNLGKALIEEMEKLWLTLDVTESGGIASTERNVALVMKGLKEASRESGFITLFLAFCAIDCLQEHARAEYDLVS